MNTNSVHSEYQSLSIRVFSDGFSLWLKDLNQKCLFHKHIVYTHYQSINDFPDLLMQQTEISSNIGNLYFIIETDFYDIIPTTIFNKEYTNDYIRFRYPEINDQFKIISKEFPRFGANMVFAIPENLHNFLSHEFPDAQILFHPELLLQEVSAVSISEIILFQRKRYVDILVLNNQHISVFNHFSFKTSEDIVYQVLNFIQTMNIPENKYMLKLFCEDNSSTVSQKLQEFCTITESKTIQHLHENHKW